MIELALLDQAVPTLQAPEVPDQRSLYERGVEARLAGRFPEALELFETQLALKPEDVDSRLNAALCLIALTSILLSRNRRRSINGHKLENVKTTIEKIKL